MRPYGELQDHIGEAASFTNSRGPGKTIVFYCAFRQAFGDGGAGGPGSRLAGAGIEGRNVGLDEGRRRDALTLAEA
jgi:hypothetical protein